MSEECSLVVCELDSPRRRAANEPPTQFLTPHELRSLAASGKYLRMLGRYRRAELHVDDYRSAGRIWPFAMLLPPLAREARIADDRGFVRCLTLGAALGLVARAAWDWAVGPFVPSRCRHRLHRELGRVAPSCADLAAPPLYLRADLWFGIEAGGSVGHIAGVVNNLGAFTGRPIVLTTDTLPLVDPWIETHVVDPGERFRSAPEQRMAAFSDTMYDAAKSLLGGRAPGFIYQRYSAFNYSGLALAGHYGVPLVLEYNGSAVWMSRHWHGAFRHEALAEEIELANLRAADLVVVVSRVMADELAERAVDPARVLVNPNGVDPETYSPGIDGTTVQREYGLQGKRVVGFIGTFGPWHGAEVLAEAFGLLLQRQPAYRDTLRLLMVGDGVTMSEVVRNLEKYGALDSAILTGIVPQAEGPAHLAACDVLVSPHVPNPDGTPFFGSPTKLFEYMAMGKGIVASDLDQIGEVLEDERTAVLVEPGDPAALAGGIARLLEDPLLRSRLGSAARAEVVEKYTWKEHTRRIIEALEARCGGQHA